MKTPSFAYVILTVFEIVTLSRVFKIGWNLLTEKYQKPEHDALSPKQLLEEGKMSEGCGGSGHMPAPCIDSGHALRNLFTETNFRGHQNQGGDPGNPFKKKIMFRAKCNLLNV